jgi:hypothetical protein
MCNTEEGMIWEFGSEFVHREAGVLFAGQGILEVQSAYPGTRKRKIH